MQHGLITRPQALARGMKSADIQRHVARGHWVVAGRGVYRVGGAPRTYEQSVQAATLAVRGSVACLRSAAWLYKLPIGLDDDFEEIEIAIVQRTRERSIKHLTVFRVEALDLADRSRPLGVPATSISRTVLDLPEVLDQKVAGKVLDHVLARKRTTLDYLGKRLAALAAVGADRGLAAALLAERQGRRHHPDSWYQARLVELVRRLGLEGWLEEHEVVLPNGKRRRLDLAFVLLFLGIEVVSYLHHSQLVEWAADQARNNELVGLGWWILYITTYDIEHDPDGVAQQILAAVARLTALRNKIADDAG